VGTAAVTSFAEFADRLLAACGHADRASTGLAVEMARAAEDQARHFTHPGRARDDALALFWQVAPAAFADSAAFAAADGDPSLTADRMVAAIRASPLARDFTIAPLPEAFFRAVARSMLQVMQDRAAAGSPSPTRDRGFHTG
jgi:hypothetical protein